MSQAMQFYISLIGIYAAIDFIAAWGLNLQFGVAGLLSFAFIIFQAAGAYVCAVLSLGPASAGGGFQHYIGGLALPFPLPLIGGVLAGALLSIPIGLVTLRRLRSDYQAVALLVISIVATDLVTNYVPMFNGAAGLALVPKPLFGSLRLSTISYQWVYLGFCAIICLAVFLFVQRLTYSPLGRAMRAMRDNEKAALALGKNVVKFRLMAFAIGGGLGGLSGALLVQFIGTWAPSGWLYPETFVLFAAIILGGSGNNVGVMLGVLILPVGLSEGSQFLPAFANAAATDSLQWVFIGLVMLAFMWFRPQGVVPEKKRKFRSARNWGMDEIGISDD